MGQKKIVRCVRNCNPVNIRRSESHQVHLNGRVSTDEDKVNIRKGSAWKGLRAEQNDGAFCQFETMAYGWRAAFILLGRTYYEKYHLNTIKKIISRWAPECENNTKAYIYYVAKQVGVNECDPLPPPRVAPAVWMRIAWAMFEVEAGRRNVVSSPEKDTIFEAMKQGFDMAIV